MNGHILSIMPNIIAMICSCIAMIQLKAAAAKIGGVMGKILKLLIIGIFFAVFLHAGFELVEALSSAILPELLMMIMGVLITIGSLFFIAAGTMAKNAFKE